MTGEWERVAAICNISTVTRGKDGKEREKKGREGKSFP
jgi:hypothetical protein